MTSFPPPPPTPPPAPPPASGAPGPYGAQPVWAPPPGSMPPGSMPPGSMPPGYGRPRTDGTAVAALVVAIASFVVCVMVPAIVALALAHAAGNKIDASEGRLTGNGLVRAAQIIAWVNIGLVTVFAVLLAIGLVRYDSDATSLRALVGAH